MWRQYYCGFLANSILDINNEVIIIDEVGTDRSKKLLKFNRQTNRELVADWIKTIKKFLS